MLEESFQIQTNFSAISGEETLADKLYQKIYIAYQELTGTQLQHIDSRIALLNERKNELAALQEQIAAQKLF